MERSYLAKIDCQTKASVTEAFTKNQEGDMSIDRQLL